jgi:N,N-dimethylformamidase beta subunit-like, C-terminal
VADDPLEAAFRRDSYRPGESAALQIFAPARGLAVQIFHAGPERGPTLARNVMRGVPVGQRIWIGSREAAAIVRVPIGPWSSGLYFAQLTSVDGHKGFAPFIVRPRRIGEHKILVVLPTFSWQAYNFRDENGDGVPDTWYADRHRSSVRLLRPFLDRGVPPRFHHFELPFLHWLARTGKQADFISDSDLDFLPDARALSDAYDLIVFPSHHEYATEHEFELVKQYRDLGGNLMFLFANDFFWRVVLRGDSIVRTRQFRAIGRPEAAVIGVQYRGSDRGEQKGPWIVRRTAGLHWLFAGTGLRPGSRFGSGGVEIDHTTSDSPPGTSVVAEIPRLYGPGFTAQMTYYQTAVGAKVFAAGAFLLTESILEPELPLPDRKARRNEPGARRMLENLWAHLSKP